MAKMKSFRLLVLTPSFLGHGAEGRLVQPGSEVIMDLPIAAKDITATVEGEEVVVTKAGEPIVGKNLQVIEEAVDGAVATVPAGLPSGAVPAGDGRWLVPVGAGTTYELWTPGDPTSDLTRQPPEAFAANRAEAEASPAARFDPPVDPRFNHDDKGGAGGSLTDEDMVALLKGYGVEVPEGSGRPELMKLVAAEKAKRIPAAAPAPGTETGKFEWPEGLSRAAVTKQLDDWGVQYKPVGTPNPDLLKLYEDEKAKRDKA